MTRTWPEWLAISMPDGGLIEWESIPRASADESGATTGAEDGQRAMTNTAAAATAATDFQNRLEDETCTETATFCCLAASINDACWDADASYANDWLISFTSAP